MILLTLLEVQQKTKLSKLKFVGQHRALATKLPFSHRELFLFSKVNYCCFKYLKATNNLTGLGSDMRDAMSSSVIENNSVNLHTTVVDLVKEFFHSADESEHKYKLSVLTETGLSLATQEYVEKEEATALHSIVKHQIKKTVQYTV